MNRNARMLFARVQVDANQVAEEGGAGVRMKLQAGQQPQPWDALAGTKRVELGPMLL